MARIRSVKPTTTVANLVLGDDYLTGTVPNPRGPGSDRLTALYRFYDAEMGLLYVGVTTRLMERWTSHKRTAPWWWRIAFLSTEIYPSMVEALTAERIAIRTEWPAHNRRSAA